MESLNGFVAAIYRIVGIALNHPIPNSRKNVWTDGIDKRSNFSSGILYKNTFSMMLEFPFEDDPLGPREAKDWDVDPVLPPASLAMELPVEDRYSSVAIPMSALIKLLRGLLWVFRSFTYWLNCGLFVAFPLLFTEEAADEDVAEATLATETEFALDPDP